MDKDIENDESRLEEDDDSSLSGTEGVRILDPDEAAAALEANSGAGRIPDDALRYGDVPPAPQGPRPAHRFPLPGSVDPARAVPKPPIADTVSGPGEPQLPHWTEPPTGEVPRIW